MTDEPARADGDLPASDDATTSAGFRYRRAPRYRPFILSGAIVGAVAGVVVGVAGPETARYSASTQIAYLAALFALLGGVVGGVTAVLAERRSR